MDQHIRDNIGYHFELVRHGYDSQLLLLRMLVETHAATVNCLMRQLDRQDNVITVLNHRIEALEIPATPAAVYPESESVYPPPAAAPLPTEVDILEKHVTLDVGIIPTLQRIADGDVVFDEDSDGDSDGQVPFVSTPDDVTTSLPCQSSDSLPADIPEAIETQRTFSEKPGDTYGAVSNDRTTVESATAERVSPKQYVAATRSMSSGKSSKQDSGCKQQ